MLYSDKVRRRIDCEISGRMGRTGEKEGRALRSRLRERWVCWSGVGSLYDLENHLRPWFGPAGGLRKLEEGISEPKIEGETVNDQYLMRLGRRSDEQINT